MPQRTTLTEEMMLQNDSLQKIKVWFFVFVINFYELSDTAC